MGLGCHARPERGTRWYRLFRQIARGQEVANTGDDLFLEQHAQDDSREQKNAITRQG